MLAIPRSITSARYRIEAGTDLQRRATAPRRIGVAHQLRELADPDRWLASLQLRQLSNNVAGPNV